MNASCPHCGTVYRIDPERVPAGGVRARCSRCEGIFRVSPAASGTPAEAPPSPPAQAVPQEAPAPRAAAPEAPGAPEPAPAPPPAPPPAPSLAPSGPPRPAFGASDPHEKARRLARALVSDIVVYHRERHERSLREGTLRQEFREEIRKSWDEYVAQVGEALARSTSYFRDALNEKLARGTAVF